MSAEMRMSLGTKSVNKIGMAKFHVPSLFAT